MWNDKGGAKIPLALLGITKSVRIENFRNTIRANYRGISCRWNRKFWLQGIRDVVLKHIDAPLRTAPADEL